MLLNCLKISTTVLSFVAGALIVGMYVTTFVDTLVSDLPRILNPVQLGVFLIVTDNLEITHRRFFLWATASAVY